MSDTDEIARLKSALEHESKRASALADDTWAIAKERDAMRDNWLAATAELSKLRARLAVLEAERDRCG